MTPMMKLLNQLLLAISEARMPVRLLVGSLALYPTDARAEIVLAATPIDLAQVLDIDKPVVRARYDYQDIDTPGLGGIVDAFLDARR